MPFHRDVTTLAGSQHVNNNLIRLHYIEGKMRFLTLPEHFTHPPALADAYNTLQFPDADKDNHTVGKTIQELVSPIPAGHQPLSISSPRSGLMITACKLNEIL